jgi:ferritin-like metal-binding protein YciE
MKTKKTTPGKKPAIATKVKSLAKKAVSPIHHNGIDEDRENESGRGAMLDKYFTDLLKDIYWAEKHLVKELTKMGKNATSGELREAFENHSKETEGQVERLGLIFELLGKKPQAKKCEAMEGLIEEAAEALEETEDDSFTRDVALIVTAQKVEHYEIAAYGSLAQIARTMGHAEVAELLEETLQEEKEADQLLTHVAVNHINEDAAMEEEAAEEE